MATNKLTDIEVKQTSRRASDYKITDGGGLYLLIKNNGTVAYSDNEWCRSLAGCHRPRWHASVAGYDHMLGFVILLGTIVNNPILIVEQTRRNLDERQLLIVEAVASRLRPILMSTATTVFGLAPLVFIPGAGTELYRGVGIVVLCGLTASMVLTLSVLPCLLIEVLDPEATWRHKLTRFASRKNVASK